MNEGEVHVMDEIERKFNALVLQLHLQQRIGMNPPKEPYNPPDDELEGVLEPEYLVEAARLRRFADIERRENEHKRRG